MHKGPSACIMQLGLNQSLMQGRLREPSRAENMVLESHGQTQCHFLGIQYAQLSTHPAVGCREANEPAWQECVRVLMGDDSPWE